MTAAAEHPERQADGPAGGGAAGDAPGGATQGERRESAASLETRDASEGDGREAAVRRDGTGEASDGDRRPVVAHDQARGLSDGEGGEMAASLDDAPSGESDPATAARSEAQPRAEAQAAVGREVSPSAPEEGEAAHDDDEPDDDGSDDEADDEEADDEDGSDDEQYQASGPDAANPTREGEGRALPAGETRCGFVSIIGAPNAGKSTLTNALVGTKISIVSRKVQTTRAQIRGIALHGASQIILVDTPGIFRPKRRLDRAMVDAAWGGARDADAVVVLIDAAKGLEEQAENLLRESASLGGPVALALNKVDLIAKARLLELATRASAFRPFDRVFMISALEGDGVADMLAYLAGIVPPGPWLYPEDQISDAPQRHWAAEVTREKMFERLHDELPYASTVETTDWKTLKDGSTRIEQTIYVERDGQKKIVLGAGGATIKTISMMAREELAEALEGKVHLFLFVKVRGGWGDDPERYREMGLEFPRGES